MCHFWVVLYPISCPSFILFPTSMLPSTTCPLACPSGLQLPPQTVQLKNLQEDIHTPWHNIKSNKNKTCFIKLPKNDTNLFTISHYKTTQILSWLDIKCRVSSTQELVWIYNMSFTNKLQELVTIHNRQKLENLIINKCTRKTILDQNDPLTQ